MAEKSLGKRDLEQMFEGFEKRQDKRLKGFEERIVDRFHVVSEGLIDQIKLLAEGHTGIIDRLGQMEKENEREHLETRAVVKLSFAELDKRLCDLELQMKELQEWRKQVETRIQT
ncbi:MAG: hypothetical protein A2170_07860 [Deltaproteobacteria bacterium RBG_13_53_10]|nr:MAG: hypothetical protein A2170_07860 [Deltaproteobacteria bacterium RBG_13_53_10]